MAIKWIRQAMLFILLVLLQVWLLNRICLFGFAIPVFYIYFVIKLPLNTNRNLVILLSFLMGLFIDMFEYSSGINMLATTIAGFSRHYLLNLFTPRDMVEFNLPSMKVFGKGLFMRYAGLVVIIHQVILFTIDSFSLLDPLMLLSRIAGSIVLTLLLIFAAEGLTIEKTKTA